MKTPRTILLLLAVFGCNLCSLAQRSVVGSSDIPQSPFNSPTRENGTISGIVQDMHNHPLKDVRVELLNANGVAVNSAYTSISGNFEFSHVPQGSYTVVASSGLQQSSEHVEANAWSNVVALHMQSADKPEDGVAGNAISVAQYKVPGKARDEYRKAHEVMEKGKLEEAGDRKSVV